MQISAVQAVFPDPLDVALGQECVVNWLKGLRPVTAPTYKSIFKNWLLWLWQKPGWAGRMPNELLDWQEQAEGRQRKLLLNLMKDFVQEKGGTWSSMQVKLSHLRTFFLANDVEIPEALNWNPEPTKEPVQGKLTFDQVREIIHHAKPRDQAVLLTMLQGLLDRERFHQFNLKYAGPLVDRLQSKDLDAPFRIDFLNGRKRNKKKFYTFIYHDALAAWQVYFDRIRGSYPKPGEPIAVCDRPFTKKTENGECTREREARPLPKDAPADVFDTIARQLKYKPPIGAGGQDKGWRTGVAVHDAFRDVVKSRLQTAKRNGFDMTCTDFWMGHKIDPYNYNRFTDNEPDYVLENAKIAAQYLNVITGPGPDSEQLKRFSEENQALRVELAKQGEEIRQLRGMFETQIKKGGFTGS